MHHVSMRLLVAGLCALPILAAPACAQEEGAATRPAAGAETDADAIAVAERIQKKVEELRGLPFLHPVKKGIYGKEELATFLAGELGKEKERAKMRLQQGAWKLFGLLPESYDLDGGLREVLMEQIGGFYDPKRKELRVMRGFGGLLGDILMAHELCHALEDQHFDLQGIDDAIEAVAPDDDDRVFAAHAVMEGSATNLMTAFTTELAFSGKARLDEILEADRANPALSGEKALAAPPIVVRPLMEMYLSGASFLVRGNMLRMGKASEKDLRRAFDDLPLSSEQILHPEKFWKKASERDVPRVVTLPDLGPVLGGGWERVGKNVLGEIGVAILTAPPPKKDAAEGMEAMQAMLFQQKTTKASSGWDGDVYELWQGPEGAQLLLWASVWDSDLDAEEMQAALASRPGVDVSTRREGPILVATFAPEGVSRALAAAARDAALEKIGLRDATPIPRGGERAEQPSEKPEEEKSGG